MRLRKKLITLGLILFCNIMIFITCHNKEQQSELPSDQEMIEYFSLNKSEFEELKDCVLMDTLFRYYPFIGRGHDAEYEQMISDKSKNYYRLKMDTLNINTIIKGEGAYVALYSAGKGDATWGIDKGYYYTVGEIEDTDDKKVVNGDLWEECKNLRENNCILYKKIEDNWYLFLRYEK